MRYLCLILIAVTATLSARPPDAAVELRLRSAFQLSAELRFQEAQPIFVEIAAQPGASQRAARYGLAANSLSHQPRTEKKVDEASRLFHSVAAENPDDPLGIASAYFLARIPYIHRQSPDFADGIKRLSALHAAHPGTYFGELAAVKVAILKLYAPRLPGTDDVNATLLEQEKICDSLTRPDARRLMHLALADAWLWLRNDSARALPHLEALHEIPLVKRDLHLSSLVRLGEIARELGRPELAAKAYEDFLSAAPRDDRAWLVKQRLAPLKRGNRP